MCTQRYTILVERLSLNFLDDILYMYKFSRQGIGKDTIELCDGENQMKKETLKQDLGDKVLVDSNII